jgi:chromosome segregation ATPase
VGEAVQGIDLAQQAVKNLQGIFTAHMDDLSRIDDLKRWVDELKGECNKKDAIVKSHATTISTLRAMDHEAKAGIEDQLKQIDKEKEELKEERTKLRKRVEAATAEEQYTMKRDFEERVARHDETHETRMKELEVESAQKIDEVNTRAVALEAEKTRVLATAEQQEKNLKAQADELDELKEKYDSLNRVKDSFKREKEDLEKELEMIKKEFALDNKTAAYLYAS